MQFSKQLFTWIRTTKFKYKNLAELSNLHFYIFRFEVLPVLFFHRVGNKQNSKIQIIKRKEK